MSIRVSGYVCLLALTAAANLAVADGETAGDAGADTEKLPERRSHGWAAWRSGTASRSVPSRSHATARGRQPPAC